MQTVAPFARQHAVTLHRDERLRERRLTDGTLLVSSHGNAISLYLHHLDPDVGFTDWQAMRKPDLYGIRDGTWQRVAIR